MLQEVNKWELLSQENKIARMLKRVYVTGNQDFLKKDLGWLYLPLTVASITPKKGKKSLIAFKSRIYRDKFYGSHCEWQIAVLIKNKDLRLMSHKDYGLVL